MRIEQGEAATCPAAKGGRIVDIHPTPRKFLRGLLSRTYTAMAARPKADDMDTVKEYARTGVVDQPIAQVVPLSQAIDALTNLELYRAAGSGRLVITSP